MSEESTFKGIDNEAVFRQPIETMRQFLTPGWQMRIRGDKATLVTSTTLSVYFDRPGYQWIENSNHTKLLDIITDRERSLHAANNEITGKNLEIIDLERYWLHCNGFKLIWRGIKRILLDMFIKPL